LAAGPSLSKAAKTLELCQTRGPLIAVDTALSTLAAQNLSADLTCCVDGNPSTAKHLPARVAADSILAFQPFACPSFVEAFHEHWLAVPEGDRFGDAASKVLP